MPKDILHKVETQNTILYLLFITLFIIKVEALVSRMTFMVRICRIINISFFVCVLVAMLMPSVSAKSEKQAGTPKADSTFRSELEAHLAYFIDGPETITALSVTIIKTIKERSESLKTMLKQASIIEIRNILEKTSSRIPADREFLFPHQQNFINSAQNSRLVALPQYKPCLGEKLSGFPQS